MKSKNLKKDLKKHGFSSADAETHIERIIWALNKASAEACSSPTLLLYDDFDKAPDSVQKGLIGIFGTRMFRDYRLHPLSLVMCCGNRVGDDILSGDLSQSILGRITVVQMEARFKDFQAYAAENPDQIHPQVIGFLSAPSNRDLLFQPIEEGAYRAPSPRGWWEVSQHFFLSPDDAKDDSKKDTSRWTGIVERKCGTGVKNQWVAWFTILSKINVPQILKTGKHPKPASENENMFQYACIFAVARHLSENKIVAGWSGLEEFVKSLKPEFQIALLIQIAGKKRTQIATKYPDAMNQLMGHLVNAPKGVTGAAAGV